MTISMRPIAGGTFVSVHGELDIESATRLRTALMEALETCEDGGGLTLDLSEVAFCDSTGLNALLRARLRAHSEHRSLTITAASPQVARLLEMTGAARLFAVTS
ncbi:STAS domain-containing protein [Streptomyces sp. NPDC015130]|uniref:STAS domain-containing protein n=1 Tax=Streptomyces sp. NPDC015130 TaxID=3364940 RepID=UPI0036FBAAC1